MSYPSGSISPAPNSEFRYDQATQLYSTVQAPTLVGRHPAFYDRALSRWLPVEQRQVSPDGSSYAYGIPHEAAIRIVDVATGSSRTVPMPALPPYGIYVIAGYDSSGIYVASNSLEAPQLYPSGLWVVNPSTGSYRTIDATMPASTVEAGAVWVPTLNASDASPWLAPFDGSPTANELDRIELATGHRESWFFAPGANVRLLGFAPSGAPLVWTVRGQPSAQEEALWLVPSAGHAVPIDRNGLLNIEAESTDERGLWIGGNQGLWLYTEATGVSQVTSTPAWPAGSCK